MAEYHIHIHTSEGGEPAAPVKPKKAKRRAATSKPAPTTPAKPKRKLTAHNKFISKELKRLKKAHPRTSQPQLMKKANANWRKKKKK